MGDIHRDLTRIDWRAFADQGEAKHGGDEPKKRFWQRRPAWMQKKDPCGLEEWNPRARHCVEINHRTATPSSRGVKPRHFVSAQALQNERSVLDAPNSVFDIKKTWAEMLPYVIESLGVILSAWFSFSIAHFGPKVEPQLAWAITASAPGVLTL